MYIRKTYQMGRYREVHNYFPANYGAPGMKRGPCRKKTPEDVEKANMRERIRRIKGLILCNFGPGDYHLILNYRPGEQPEDFGEAGRQLQKFHRKMRTLCRKAGKEYKYIAITERGRRGSILHHHLIIQDIEGMNTARVVKECWEHGNCYFSGLYEEGEYEKLAGYLAKKETKDAEGGKSYSASRNLQKPAVKTERMARRIWPEPKAPKGWILIKDSVVEGENPVTGYPYQHYMIRREDVWRLPYSSRHP